MCWQGTHWWIWMGKDTANNDTYRCGYCGTTHTPVLRVTTYIVRT